MYVGFAHERVFGKDRLAFLPLALVSVTFAAGVCAAWRSRRARTRRSPSLPGADGEVGARHVHSGREACLVSGASVDVPPGVRIHRRTSPRALKGDSSARRASSACLLGRDTLSRLLLGGDACLFFCFLRPNASAPSVVMVRPSISLRADRVLEHEHGNGRGEDVLHVPELRLHPFLAPPPRATANCVRFTSRRARAVSDIFTPSVAALAHDRQLRRDHARTFQHARHRQQRDHGEEAHPAQERHGVHARLPAEQQLTAGTS